MSPTIKEMVVLLGLAGDCAEKSASMCVREGGKQKRQLLDGVGEIRLDSPESGEQTEPKSLLSTVLFH